MPLMLENAPHVLIVDDEPTSVEVLCALLEEHINIHIATNANESFSVLNKQHIDIILMDADIPETSGFAITQQIKQTPELKDIPVLFISNYSDLSYEIKAFESGALDYLIKPINPSRLLIRINSHLNIHLPIPSY